MAWILWTALVVGTAFRLSGLETHSLWFDETMTVSIAQSEDLVSVLKGDRNPPLNYLMFRSWMNEFGQADPTLRLLPALLSTLTLLLVAIILPRVVPREQALIATCVLGLSPFSVWYSQEVRAYALLELGCVMHTLGLLWFMRREELKWVGITLTACGAFLAIGAHYSGYLIAAQAGVISGLLWFRGKRVPAALTAAASLLGLTLWLGWLITILPVQLRNDWGSPAPPDLLGILWIPAGLILAVPDAPPFVPRWVPWVAVLAIAAAIGGALWGAVRRKLDSGALTLLATPFATALVVAALFIPMLGARYLVSAELALILVVAQGMCMLPRRPRVAATCLFLGCLVAICAGQKAVNLREDFRYACQQVVDNWREGDHVTMLLGTPRVTSQSPARHYLRARLDILAALIDERALRTDPVGGRLHVVFRAAPYSWPHFNALLQHYAKVHEAPMRNRVQYVLLHKKQ